MAAAKAVALLSGALGLLGCAHHPMDCAVGFYHSDCLPGTAGYEDPDVYAAVDDKQCQSYGLTLGTPAYADCRLRLVAMRRGQEIGGGVVVSVPVK